MGCKNCGRGSRERAEEVKLCWGNVDFTLRPKPKDLGREITQSCLFFRNLTLVHHAKKWRGDGQNCCGEPRMKQYRAWNISKIGEDCKYLNVAVGF